jgi:hypothetical protein
MGFNIYHTSPAPQNREKRKKGLQLSEIKALRFASIPSSAIAPEGTDGLDFIHLLVKKQVPWLSGKARLFIMEKLRIR